MRYREDTPLVLRGLTVAIGGGQRVGGAFRGPCANSFTRRWHRLRGRQQVVCQRAADAGHRAADAEESGREDERAVRLHQIRFTVRAARDSPKYYQFGAAETYSECGLCADAAAERLIIRWEGEAVTRVPGAGLLLRWVVTFMKGK